MSPLFTGNFFGFRGAGGAVMAPIILSTSQSTVNNTITLGTVSAGNTIVIFTTKSDSILSGPPSGFTQRALTSDSEGGSLAVYTKVATGSETTITGDWQAAASWVIDGIVSVVGTPQGSTAGTTSTAPSINVLPGSLVSFLAVFTNSNQEDAETVTTPPVGWTEEVRVDGEEREIYVYSRVYESAQATGDVTAIWSGSGRVNSVLVSFIRS